MYKHWGEKSLPNAYLVEDIKMENDGKVIAILEAEYDDIFVVKSFSWL